MTVRVAAALAALLVLVTAGCSEPDPQVPPGDLRIATGSAGGVYYTYGQGLADLVRERIPTLRPSVMRTEASFENVQLVRDRRAEVGFTQADIIADAVGPGGRGVVALARLYDDYLHLVVRENAPINRVDDLRGRTVSIGAQGSGTAITVTRVLDVAGVDPERDFAVQRLGLDQSVVALREGRIDAVFFSGGLPVVALTDLTALVPIRLVDLGGYAAGLSRKYGQFYAEHAVPASTYGLNPATTVGVPNYLVVSPDLPEATAYALTRALFDGRESLARVHPAARRLNYREAISTYGLALHPGAAQYYRDAKI